MFKKSMAALAVLSLSAGLASASEVTLYGIVDNGLHYKHSKVEADGVSKKTDSFALESGISSTSRFGIKGSEDLGNGMTVSFKLENGFNADDGSFGDDRLFNRESSLTLSGDFGKLSFGRMGAIGSAAGDFDAAFAIGDAFDGGDGDVFGFATSDRYDNRSPTRHRASPAFRPRSSTRSTKAASTTRIAKTPPRSTAISASR